MPYILPDITEGADAAASTATSYSLGVGQTAQGIIASLGDHDWYRISLVAGQTYTFAEIGTGTNSLYDTFLYLRDSNGAVVASDDDSGPGRSSSLTFTAATTGTYYVDAGAFGNTSTGQYGISATLGTRPNFNISMGAGAIDAYASWSSLGTGATVTYGFRQSTATYTVSGSNISTFTQCTAAEMVAVQSILQLWSDVAGVTFVQVNPGGYTDNATILIGNYSDPNDGAGAFAFYPGSTASSDSAGDLWLNLSGGVNSSSIPFGSWTWQTIMHELGHALGLSHPGDYNAAPSVTITYANNAQFVQDSAQYTVMSYFGGSNTGESPGSYGTAESPMLFDIYELQQIYGANTNTRTGNTIYGFGSNAGSIYDFSLNSAPNFSIWDAGGIDTLNCSGYSAAELINLNAGTFSNIGGGTANVSISLGVVIENARGGSGADTLIGNSADNILEGGGDPDNIDGRGGSDYVSFMHALWGTYIDLNGQFTWDSISQDTLISIENAIGSPFHDVLLGDGTDNILEGGGGPDNIDGRGGSDYVSFMHALWGTYIDLNGQFTWDSISQDTLISIENAIGSPFHDVIIANVVANVLTGGTGADDFVFNRGFANGDRITDFAADDQLIFQGYGTAAQGASLTQNDATHWTINSSDGVLHDVLTVSNGFSLQANNYHFA